MRSYPSFRLLVNSDSLLNGWVLGPVLVTSSGFGLPNLTGGISLCIVTWASDCSTFLMRYSSELFWLYSGILLLQ